MLTAVRSIAASRAAAPATVASTVSDWLDEHGPDILVAALILVAAVVLNLIVRRSIRLAVERLVKASEARRERAEREDAEAGRAAGRAGAEDAAGRAGAEDAAGRAGEDAGVRTDEGAEAAARRTAALVRERAERLRAAALLSERAEQRTRTVGFLLRYLATIVIFTVAVFMALSELGIDIAPLIASAGIAGIALGFGAQSLVKDFIAGTFMLLEDQFGVGDFVDLGEASGTVERVTLRVTTLRGDDGTVWYVPNGQVVRVGNKSQRWARAILDIEVAYDTDVARASAVIKRVADEFWREQVPGATVIEEPDLRGVQHVSPSAVVLRLAVKTRPGEQWAVGRELRARLKTAFDEAGIAAPPPVPGMWLTGGPPGGAPPASGRGGVSA